MPHHEAFKRAGEPCSSKKIEIEKEAYLGAELSLQNHVHTPAQRNDHDKIWPPPRSNSRVKNTKAVTTKAKNTPQAESEKQARDEDDDNPTLVTPSKPKQSKENNLPVPNKVTTNKEFKVSKKNEDEKVTSSSQNYDTMNEILKRLDKIVERQEKQEQETENLKVCQENQMKETASLRDAFEQEKARRLEMEKEFTKENVKALQKQPKDSRKTTALKEIFSFFLQSMNSGNSGSAAAGQLDAILSKYIIDDGHHAFIGNQIKAAGEFICKKDSLTEEHISRLTDYLYNKQ